MAEPPDLELPARMALAEPASFLEAVSRVPWFHLNLDHLEVIEMWALVALAALARDGRPDAERCDVYHRAQSPAGRFARAVGFDETAVPGSSPARGAEPDRTVTMRRVPFGSSAEATARGLAKLAIPDEAESESRDALAYVVDELLRNVLQHSSDPLGAVVGAQLMREGKGGYTRPTIQVAVADNGKGILASLRRSRTVHDAEAALEMALRAHVSGTFPEGQTGGADNAGLGLFFTSEMAKLTAGRLLLASRGAALFVDGDESEAGIHRIDFVPPPGTGYPGTLAVFELPIEVQDRDRLLETIRERASSRIPAATSRHWFAYDAPPPDAERFAVHGAVSQSALAEQMRASLAAGRAITVDFTGIRISTQSFLHALLFHPIRVGWAMGARIHVVNADSAVRSGLDYLESYALS